LAGWRALGAQTPGGALPPKPCILRTDLVECDWFAIGWPSGKSGWGLLEN